MKIRSDFVTNSSSSSFILGFKNDDDIESVVTEMIKDFESNDNIVDNLVESLMNHINSNQHLSRDQIYELNQHEADDDSWYELFQYYSRRMSMKDAYDFLETEEGQAQVRNLAKEDLQNFKSELENFKADYFVQIEVCDDGAIDSELEQFILPRCDLTVKWFNHH